MNQQSVDIARYYGRILSLVSAATALLFLIGVLRRSYLALAVPVAALVLGAAAVSLLIGRLLITTPDYPEDPLP